MHVMVTAETSKRHLVLEIICKRVYIHFGEKITSTELRKPFLAHAFGSSSPYFLFTSRFSLFESKIKI